MQRPLIFGSALAALLLLCAFVYAPGFSALPGYDDEPNLRHLNAVSDWRSARDFVFSGIGTIGRPLALATFLPYAGDWQSLYADILRDNLLIHLLNICLVAWCALRLYRLVEPRATESRAATGALLAAALWGLSPLLVSASLSAIQRMTSLSALFLLAGFLVYLVGRTRLAREGGRAGLLTMSLGVVAGTGLATLCKENGALLPALLLVIECTLLMRPAHVSRWFGWWKAVFLGLPTAAVVLFLLSTLSNSPEAYAHRDFSLAQRVLSQPLVLLEYLLNAFLPRRAALTPFHDDYLTPGLAVGLGAFVLWGVVVWGAWALRRVSVWPAFAVAWYLVAHMLESSVIPLELYFEHRNYVPLVGVWIAVAAMLGDVPQAARRVMPVVVATYIVLIASVSFAHASLWGQPSLAARMWAAAGESSERAQQYLSQQLLREGDHPAAWLVLDEAGARPGGSATLLLQSIHVGCGIDEARHRAERFDELMERTPTTSLSFAFHDGIRKLSAAIAEGSCDGLEHHALLSLIDRLRQNPKYVANASLRKFLLQAEAQVFVDMGRGDDALEVVRQIYDVQPDTDTAVDIALQYLIRGNEALAREYLMRERSRQNASQFVSETDRLKLDAVSSLVSENDAPLK